MCKPFRFDGTCKSEVACKFLKEDHVLIADSESTQNFVKIRTSSSSVGAFCVELWPKQVLYRISAPMSYN